MFKNLKTKNKLQKGFTIIEVMIVLAIAGLILVVVLVAIPQLQRNQRNSARQANLARMVSEVSNYSGNNNGKIPSDTDGGVEIAEMYLRYLADVNTEDPTTGESTPIQIANYGFSTGVPVFSTDPATISYTAVDHDGDSTTPDLQLPASTGTGELGVAFYKTNTSCNGEEVTSVGAGGRNFTLVTVLEGGAVYCLDNK